MSDKCFCHFNGYEVKDAAARKNIETLTGKVQNAEGNINVLNARVDTVTSIPAGSTTENAELLDIRVGHAGGTFASAGQAVREQTRAAFQYGGFLTSGDTFFTDANNAAPDREYLINSDITASVVANLPIYGERYTLLCFSGYPPAGSYKTQMAIAYKRLYVRYQSDNGWSPWKNTVEDQYTIRGMGFMGSGLGYAFTDANDAPANSIYVVNYPSKAEFANSPFYGERVTLITLCADSDSYGFGGIHNVQMAFGAYGKFAWRTKNNSYWNRWVYPGDASNKLYTITNRPYNFNGKTFKFFGDSIVDGSEVARTYKQIFCEKVGATYTSHAVGGASFVHRDDRSSVLQQLQSTPLDSDYIFLSAGINDSGLGVEMSELSAALDETFSYIANNFGGEVFVLTPINGNYGDVGTLNELRETITYKALYYGFNVMDGSSYGFPTGLTDEAERTHWYISGGVHPSQLGHEMIAKKLSYDLL